MDFDWSCKMQIETLKDVLHWTKEFHQYLAKCLSHCRNKNESERVKMIMAYMAEHESQLSQTIEGFERKGNKKALNTWVNEYTDKHPINQHQPCDEPFASLSADEVICQVINQHQKVIELYRYLHSRADTTSAKELLENLCSLEEHDAMLMAQELNRFQDL